MLWALKQLLAPCNYLRIKQGSHLLQSKAVYDWILPISVTLTTVAICWWLNIPLKLYGHTTFISSLSNLLALLIAFYMAALAAVATFDRKGIDEKLKGEPATLRILHHDTGLYVIKELTYRQFVAYLFGYLSFISLLLFLLLMFFDNAWPKIVIHIIYFAKKIPQAINILDGIIFSMFFFAIWQMFIAAILGIYFLADRMQSLTDPHN